MRKLFCMKNLMIFLTIVFVISEWYGYNIMQQKAEKRVDIEVEEYQKDLYKEINELTDYKERLFIGDYFDIEPECIEINLNNFNSIVKSPLEKKDEHEESYNDIRDFFHFYVKKVIGQKEDNPRHKIIEELKCLYKIQIPNAAWTIEEMKWTSDCEFYINTMKPIAVGFKKGANLVPSINDACKASFLYLTKKGRFSSSFIDNPNLFDRILSLENKYFRIIPAPYVNSNGEEITKEEYLENNNFHVYQYVNSPLTVIFYEETLTKNVTDYKFSLKSDIYTEEVSNYTLLFWGIYTIIICIVFSFFIISVHIYHKKTK